MRRFRVGSSTIIRKPSVPARGLEEWQTRYGHVQMSVFFGQKISPLPGKSVVNQCNFYRSKILVRVVQLYKDKQVSEATHKHCDAVISATLQA